MWIEILVIMWLRGDRRLLRYECRSENGVLLWVPDALSLTSETKTVCLVSPIRDWPPLRRRQSLRRTSIHIEQTTLNGVYPNPVKDPLEIYTTSELSTITLLSLTRQELIGKTCSDTRATVDLGSLPAGIYMLKIAGSDRQQVIKRVVKE